MAAKLLLCVSNDHVTAAVWRRHRLTACTRFNNNEHGWAAFGNFLHGTRAMPVHIAVDTVDEDFRFETLPHARGRDRAEMVGRKLRQLYRATPYFSSELQERDSGKRRDDRYLFAALMNPDLLVPWLRALEAANLPVSGIYPLALVSIYLIAHLKLKQPNLLIISKNSAGLRQTFFKDLKFRISRLTPLVAATADADQHYADEVGNTRMYLDALNVTHVDDNLDIIILDQDGTLAELPAAVPRGRPNMHCQYLDANFIHLRFGIPVAELKSSTDVLHLVLLGEKAPALNLAPRQLTRVYQRFATGRGVIAASATILAGALIWSGVNLYRAMQINEDASSLERQTREYQTRYQQVTEQFPQAPTTMENLRNTVEMAEEIRAGLRTPEAMFALVSHALDASPQIQLSHLAWHYGRKSADTELAPAATDARARSESKALFQSAIVKGEVSPFDGDYKAAMAFISAFADRLANDERVAEVRALRLPLNASSDVGLAGSTNDKSKKGSAEFELAIAFGPGT
ncbi:MAG: hypothetical protein ACJ8G2_03000 [Burkholderiales bacterium]